MLRTAAVSLLVSLCLGCVMPPAQRDRQPVDFIELTIDDAHKAFKTRSISCEQLTQRYIKRIKTYDQPTQLNAIIYIKKVK